MMRLIGLLTLAVLVFGCSGGGSSGEPGGDTATEVSAVDIPPADTTPAEDSRIETTAPETVDPLPWGWESRGWTEVRGIVHLHSAYSHDGCSSAGWDGPGTGDPDSQCLDELRAAPCDMGIDFLMMTDHAGHGADVPYEDALQHRPDAGDELVYDDQDRPFANRVTCPAGSRVDEVLIYYGVEGSKQMPIGLAGPVPEVVLNTSYADTTPLETSQAAMAEVHALGGYVLAPHTEESSISAERIAALPLDGMEIYNAHVGFLTGMDDIDKLLGFDAFMGEGTGRNPDLSFLLIFKENEEDVTKFDYAAARTDIAIVAACDIHRNVEVPGLCPGGGGLCEPLEAEYPNFAAFLQEGGPVPLSDGDRVDSYARSFRWFTNRAWVETRDPVSVRDAVGAGRGYAVFDILGEPVGFDLFATIDEEVVEMGARRPHDGEAVVHLRTPTLQAQRWAAGAQLDFGAAELRTRLYRLTEDGAEIIAEVSGQGATRSVSVQAPCALRAEVKITPKHLAAELPGMESLADETYPYLYSNAIFLF
ncbi:MAG: hypothetical protein ABIK09_18255 [Pseudomonadota bacterium]